MVEYKGYEIPTWEEVYGMYRDVTCTEEMLKSIYYMIPIFGKTETYHINTRIRKGDIDQYKLGKLNNNNIMITAMSFIDDLINKIPKKENKNNDNRRKKSIIRGSLQQTGRKSKEHQMSRCSKKVKEKTVKK